MTQGLYAITSENLMPGDQLLSKSRAALAGGCRIIQYRNKHASPSEALEQARQLKQLCDEFSANLIINDSIEIAEKLGVGVHLGQSDTSIKQARQRLGNKAIIGSTCHDQLPLALQAIEEGANYVAFGRFFNSATKPGAPPAALSLLTMANQLPVPYVAIGGINQDNAPQLVREGARCLAVCEALFASDNLAAIQKTAEYFNHLLASPQSQ